MPCWKQIQNDWVNDGKIEGVYPLHCYGEAIKHVPEDLAQYTGIIDEINAARQRATRSKFRRLATHNSQTATPDRPGQPKSQLFQEAFNKLGPRNADSFPLPLMILGAMALVMISVGAVGLVTRRLKTPKVPG